MDRKILSSGKFGFFGSGPADGLSGCELRVFNGSPSPGKQAGNELAIRGVIV